MADNPIVVPPPNNIVGTLQPVDDMINKVVSLIGQPDDPDARALAIQALDEAAGKINLRGIYLLGLKEFEFQFVANQQTYPLPPDWGWSYGTPRLQDDSLTPPYVKQLINWVTWDQFWVGQINRVILPGIPYIFSVRSETRDGNLYTWPIPTAELETLTVHVPYITRVQRVSETTELYLTDELRTTLVSGGKAFIAMHRYLAQPNIWQPVMQLFLDNLNEFKGAADRNQSETTFQGFALDDTYNWTPRTYIKFGL